MRFFHELTFDQLLGLVVAGFILLSLAINFYVSHEQHDGALPLLILAIIVLVPGIYSLSLIIGTLRGAHLFDCI